MVGAHCSQQLRADFGAAGEGEFTHVLVGGELAADAFAGPVITLHTPAGSPARSASTAIASAENGVWLAGRITPVQPAAQPGRLCG